MKKLTTVFTFLNAHLGYFICLSILLLLLARNPFSTRTLIPNLDPFPDSIHYTNSAFSLLRGDGYVVQRQGSVMTPDVPLLYPVSLVPFFAVFQDVRAFYFTNVVLSLAAYTLFYRLIRYYFSKKRIQFILLFGYASSLTLAWYTTLAMAENLILPLFLLALNLLIGKVSYSKAVLMALVCISFYATKYASIPLTISFTLVYTVKVFLDSSVKSNRIKTLVIFLSSLTIVGFAFEAFEYYLHGKNVLTQIYPLFKDVFIIHSPSTSTAGPPHNVFFSNEFIAGNIHSYLGWLVGKTLYILWRPTQILPTLWALPAFAGLFLGLTKLKWRYLAVALLISTGTTIAFMMTFYTTDGRYLYTAFPTIFLGLGFAISYITESVSKQRLRGLTILLPSAIFLLMAIQYLWPLKSAIMLNLKYQETPWAYVSIKNLDSYLSSQSYSQPPFVITPLPPHLLDFYLHSPVKLLPISTDQDFRSNLQDVWGNYDFSNLTQLYIQLLQQQRTVYIATYGLGRDELLHQAFAEIKANFVITKVDEGCHTQCEIYQLSLKE